MGISYTLNLFLNVQTDLHFMVNININSSSLHIIYFIIMYDLCALLYFNHRILEPHMRPKCIYPDV